LMPRLFSLSSLSVNACCCWWMRLAGLAFTELIGGQSRRETVVSHTPRTGSLLSAGLVGIGGLVTVGNGVTSDFGGGEEQLASERATAMATSAADFL